MLTMCILPSRKEKKYRSQKKMASTNALTNAFTPKRHIKKLFALQTTDDRRQDRQMKLRSNTHGCELKRNISCIVYYLLF